MKFVLDTNVILDFLRDFMPVVRAFEDLPDDTTLCILPPVDYEIRRGLIHDGSTRQLRVYEQDVFPAMDWIPLEDADWQLAIQLWLQTRSQGKQPGDIDLIIAAAAYRLDATVITADKLFDAIPIPHENWRNA